MARIPIRAELVESVHELVNLHRLAQGLPRWDFARQKENQAWKHDPEWNKAVTQRIEDIARGRSSQVSHFFYRFRKRLKALGQMDYIKFLGLKEAIFRRNHRP